MINDSHPDVDQINDRKNEVLDAWANLKALATSKQEKLYGAHEIQRFNRDADETITWITEKDTLISSEYGKDLASVQTLQRKHETLERDLAALEDKVSCIFFHSGIMDIIKKADTTWKIAFNYKNKTKSKFSPTLVCLINVHARLI